MVVNVEIDLQVAGKRDASKSTTDTDGTAESTIGYTSTNEAVPMTVFYRNDSSKRHLPGGKNSIKSRPTLHQLRKNFEKDGNLSPDTETHAQVNDFYLIN